VAVAAEQKEDSRETEEGAGVRDKAVGVAVGGEEMKKVERNQLFSPGLRVGGVACCILQQPLRLLLDRLHYRVRAQNEDFPLLQMPLETV
jgi:hypothetical protein